MRTTRPLLAALGAAVALAACGGGGTTAPPPAAVSSAVPATNGRATTTMTISIPHAGTAPSAATRRPQYLSNGTASLAFYDGSTLVYIANLMLDSGTQFSTVYASSGSTTVTPGTCTFTVSNATCGLTITSTTGPHVFGLVAYPYSQAQPVTPAAALRRISAAASPSPSPSALPSTLPSATPSSSPAPANTAITSEGQVSVTLSPGTNPGVTMTMLGVADQVGLDGPSSAPYNEPATITYQIEDSTGAQIVTPGDYDNGPVTITAAPAGIVTITPNSFTTPPDGLGNQQFTVTCTNPSGGIVTISFNARTTPNTAYASGLTYSTANYSGAVINSTSFQCYGPT